MSFAATGEQYDRFVGRYLPSLAPAFADAAGVEQGMRVLDVGCGPGGLTHELAARVGPAAVAAIDPSPSFVEACRSRYPEVDVREGAAEQLPFPNDAFDAALASLVVGFMRDPAAGAREMARVTRQGGIVAACVWDTASGMTMLRTFWQAAAAVDGRAAGEKQFGTTEGELAELLRSTGLTEVEDGAITATAGYESFEDWWEPFTFGIGPAGTHLRSLDEDRREAVRSKSYELLGRPDGPFELDARAWFARGRVAG